VKVWKYSQVYDGAQNDVCISRKVEENAFLRVGGPTMHVDY